MNINSSDPNETNPAPAGDPGAVDIRHISQQQLAQLGVSQIAYIKPVVTNNGPAFAIHAADGTPMALAGDEAVAVAAVRQHEMVPALVH